MDGSNHWLEKKVNGELLNLKIDLILKMYFKNLHRIKYKEAKQYKHQQTEVSILMGNIQLTKWINKLCGILDHEKSSKGK